MRAVFSVGFSGLMIGGILQNAAGLNRDMLTCILKSRTVADAVVERFQLGQRYRASYREDAVRILQRATRIFTTRDGIIAVTVEDTDPRLAAEIATST